LDVGKERDRVSLSVGEQLIIAAAGVSLLMVVLWIVQRVRTDAGWVDVGWTGGLGMIALLFAATGDAPAVRRWAIGGACALWAFRLGVYLLLNRVVGKQAEDGRYQTLRAHWGERAQFNFFWFFQAQALLAWMFALPVLAAIHVPGASGMWIVHWAGVAVVLIAVVGEAIADAQLARYRANPANKGKTCRDGMWRYSRHPNYFFEWVHWWGYVLASVGSPWFLATLFAPALMLFFLFRVTGIPYTERQALASRGDDYREYQRTTSAFFPWFPGSTRA
jgi:steroid 5-alpha reductase family enzyme